MDAANLLKPALARGELRCIGATTLAGTLSPKTLRLLRNLVGPSRRAALHRRHHPGGYAQPQDSV